MSADENNQEDQAHRDPITGAPGAHPLGTGVGATGGALAGAAAGSLAGPVGTVVGLVAGAFVGGLGGKAVAEGVNPTEQESYWRANYRGESYYEEGRPYEDYGPAYELGWSGRANWGGDFAALEPEMASEWEDRRGNSDLEWTRARHAALAAWARADDASYGMLATPPARDEVNELSEQERDELTDQLAAARKPI